MSREKKHLSEIQVLHDGLEKLCCPVLQSMSKLRTHTGNANNSSHTHTEHTGGMVYMLVLFWRKWAHGLGW